MADNFSFLYRYRSFCFITLQREVVNNTINVLPWMISWFKLKNCLYPSIICWINAQLSLTTGPFNAVDITDASTGWDTVYRRYHLISFVHFGIFPYIFLDFLMLPCLSTNRHFCAAKREKSLYWFKNGWNCPVS